jgi:nucleoside-diphosphate-sugar epimerase
MHVLITGAAGMIGRKLTARMLKEGRLGNDAISQLTLFDVVPAETPPNTAIPITVKTGDLPAGREAEGLIADRPDVIYHFAAIVSGEAEEEFEKGYRINLDGGRRLLDAIVAANYCPRFIFASSIAVFGAPFPDAISDEFFTTPLTSYGTQKAICELLISDYTRKGFINGLALRLPTICVRPGKPNKAASGFFSNIMREPLAGQDAILPVSEDVRHWHASPRAAVGFMMQAASLDSERVGARRAITLPGLSVTVGEQIAALRNVAGDKVVAHIQREPDDAIARIVAGWPQNFDAKRALGLGFQAEDSFEEIIKVHIDDELDGKIT